MKRRYFVFFAIVTLIFMISGINFLSVRAEEIKALKSPNEVLWDNTVATWTRNNEAEGYEVMLYKDGVQIYNFTTLENKYELRNYMYAPGSYQFSVRCLGDGRKVSDSSFSELSAKNKIRHNQFDYLERPEILDYYKSGFSSVRIYWYSVENANKYNIYIKKGSKYRYVMTVNKSTALIKRLKRGCKVYYIKVRPYIVRENEMIKGPVSRFIKVRTKK